jgi:hypothetical protein
MKNERKQVTLVPPFYSSFGHPMVGFGYSPFMYGYHHHHHPFYGGFGFHHPWHHYGHGW